MERNFLKPWRKHSHVYGWETRVPDATRKAPAGPVMLLGSERMRLWVLPLTCHLPTHGRWKQKTHKFRPSLGYTVLS